MKTSNWSILGYILGFSFSLLSAIRYFIIWKDTDRAIVYVIIGLLICGLSWLYNQNLKLKNTLDGIEEYLAR